MSLTLFSDSCFILFSFEISYTAYSGCLRLICTVWCRGDSTKHELRICAGSNPACSVSEIRNGEDLWQWSRLEIRLNTFRQSTIPQKQFIIVIIIIIIKQMNFAGIFIKSHRVEVTYFSYKKFLPVCDQATV